MQKRRKGSPPIHIQIAVEEQYIEHIINENTQLIQDDVPIVIMYLFANYRNVQSKEVNQKEREREILAMEFNPADPLIKLFGPIKKLQNLATDINIAYYPVQ